MKSTLLSIVAALMLVSLGFAQEKAAPQEKEKKAAPTETVAPAKAPAEQGTKKKATKKATKSKTAKKATKKAAKAPEKKGE